MSTISLESVASKDTSPRKPANHSISMPIRFISTPGYRIFHLKTCQHDKATPPIDKALLRDY